jgi:hypothetical protein
VFSAKQVLLQLLASQEQLVFWEQQVLSEQMQERQLKQSAFSEQDAEYGQCGHRLLQRWLMMAQQQAVLPCVWFWYLPHQQEKRF